MTTDDTTPTIPDEPAGDRVGNECVLLVQEALAAWRLCGRLPEAADDEAPAGDGA
ncbi:hypothetical protein [Spongiactinospora sp. TRM90649]|uniref:hypothetical protein n=1 Tax=Spongiactinospora sp. TRM90649 TaxID=3031114 RepID=UPI0023F7DB5B|nr:hypothetical protein [Spongiactinospora sp. TRM90649]MDF5756292.1 hypothetical protein [Spongiactinospora sp. TRM90649]